MIQKKEKNKNKEIQIIPTEDIKKDLTKPVNFRSDPETYSKIITLEKARKESKAEVIKRSINQSFEILICRRINSRIFEYMDDVFGKTNANQFHMILGLGINEIYPKEEGENLNPFEEKDDTQKTNIVFYNTEKADSYITKDKQKTLNFNLNRFLVELSLEPRNMIKIKVSLRGVINGDIKNFDANIYLRINNIVIKEGLKTETESRSKKDVNLNICIERTFPVISLNNWVKKIKKDLQQFKKVVDEIDNILKNDKKIELVKKTSEQST